ncbi:Phosphatidylglycerophosphatase and protein-tyrosine phosphatase 1, variant 2 [Sarracenia purpurea var. burkii]
MVPLILSSTPSPSLLPRSILSMQVEHKAYICTYRSRRTLSVSPTFGFLFVRKKLITCSFSGCNLKEDGDQNGDVLHYKENLRRTFLFLLVSSGLFPTLPSSGKTKTKNPYDDKRLLEQNKRIQKENNAPEDFPNFVREGFQVNVVTSENYVKRDSGLMYRDFEVGKGDCPKAGQQVTFHYVGYNESGRRIDSTYLQGSPAKIRMGTNSLVPGFEEGIQDMRPGGKRRIIIPPELGPPVSDTCVYSYFLCFFFFFVFALILLNTFFLIASRVYFLV